MGGDYLLYVSAGQWYDSPLVATLALGPHYWHRQEEEETAGEKKDFTTTHAVCVMGTVSSI